MFFINLVWWIVLHQIWYNTIHITPNLVEWYQFWCFVGDEITPNLVFWYFVGDGLRPHSFPPASFTKPKILSDMVKFTVRHTLSLPYITLTYFLHVKYFLMCYCLIYLQNQKSISYIFLLFTLIVNQLLFLLSQYLKDK